MKRAPRYYVDLRTLSGKQYKEPGTLLFVVKHGDDPNDENVVKNIMYMDEKYGQWGTDIITSGMYDLYLHRSGLGYILLRENIWLAGKDIDERVATIRKLRVGAAQNAIYSGYGDQRLVFSVTAWDDSVKIASTDGFVIIKSYYFSPATAELTIVVTPTYKASPRNFGELIFVRNDEIEARAYYFIL